MARMVFLCDSERCIECNACVTACKNEHEVPWGINRRRVVTINDGKPGERSISMACMHCTDAPCAAVCPVSCFYGTADQLVLHDKDLCIGCGYCFYACPFGAPQYPRIGNFGGRGKMDKCTYCAGGPQADSTTAEYAQDGSNRIAEGKLPLCAEMCSTKALLAGDQAVIADIYRERVQKRGFGTGAWGWRTAYRTTVEAYMMTRLRRLAVLCLLLAGPALAQQTQQAPGIAGGDPSVQSAAPEVGAGRGASGGNASGGNTVQPQTSEPQQPTGQAAQPGAAAPHAPTPPQLAIPVGPPFAARGNVEAGELELQHALRGGVIDGRVSIPNQSAGILIQPEGRDWRHFRMRILTIGGIVAIVGAIVALALFYALRGPTRIDAGRSGRRVQRFTLLERVNHWMTATSFILLALTGLNITYGVYVLRPVIGPEAFTSLTLAGQAVHHYVAFAFMLGLVVMLVLWARQNLIRRIDIEWLKAGGPLSKSHPPAGKFNAGQKGLYWLTVIGGALLSVTGILLMLPGLLDDVTLKNQWAHVGHGLVAMGMIAVIIGHIYIGSVGMEGALEAMRDGQVDVNWAREHHSAWLAEETQRAHAVLAEELEPRRRALGAD